jgi:tetratricopeptide (TPR) repeat protein
MIDEGKAEPQDLNGASWHALFIGKVGPADLENALKAAQLSDNSPDALHTLACLYTEVGKTKEAREILIHGMDLLNLDEPNPDYWYAFGRIAEQYGVRDVAIADYNRVTKPEKSVQIPDSTYRLAQMRLQALNAAPEPSSTSKKKN